jgi:hypothetical protein
MHQYDMLGRSLAAGNGYRWYGRMDVARLRRYLDRVLEFPVPTQEVPVEGYLTTYRPPGYPAFLSLVYKVAGNSWRLPLTRLLQALLMASLAPMTYAIARLLGRRDPIPASSGAIVAGYPILLLYPAGLGSENIFIPLAAAVFALLLLAQRRSSVLLVGLAGVAAGLACLTRSVMAAFIPLAAWWLWRRARPRFALVFAVIAGLFILPWAVRNSVIRGQLTFIETSLGYNLFVGYHPDSQGRFESKVAVIPLQIMDEEERGLWSMQQALDYIRLAPERVPILFLKRTAHFWDLEDRELLYFYSNGYLGPIPQPWLAMAYVLIIMPFLALAVYFPFGMVLDRRHLDLTFAFGLSLMVPYLLILAEPRFHLPLVPVLAVYAATAWHTPDLGRRLREGLGRREPAWLFAAAFLSFLVLAWAWSTYLTFPDLMRTMASGGHELLLDY